MKKQLILATALLLASTNAFAASAKSYQVTGPVLALTDSTITVQKGTEKWELNRDSATKLPDSVKVGSKVTIYYTMTAGEVDDKSPAPAKDAKAAAPAAANATTKKK